jgi:cell shape-determining protein MreD
VRVKKSYTALKWIAYILFALFLFCLQSTPSRLGIFSDVLFLLPFAVALASYEQIIPAAIASSVCGLFWDYSAQRVFGFHALIMCVLCVAVSLVMKFYIRPVYISVVVAVAVSVMVYCLADFFFFYVLRSYENVGILFVSEYLPAFLKTSVFGAGIVYLTEKIYRLSPIKAKFDNV